MTEPQDAPIIGGVCYTLGQTTSMPTWLWRAIFVISVLSFGIGVLPYIVLWIFMPKK